MIFSDPTRIQNTTNKDPERLTLSFFYLELSSLEIEDSLKRRVATALKDPVRFFYNSQSG